MIFDAFYNKKVTKNLPLYLVGAFIMLSFAGDLTRFKNLSVILMAATTIYFLFHNYRTALAPFKSTLSLCLLIFILTLFYSLLISTDPQLSIENFNKPILNGLLLFSFLIPVVLHKNTAVQIAIMILLSVAMGLLITYTRDLLIYIDDYQNGIIPFTARTHRNLSDSYVFCFPVILCLWKIYKKNSLIHWGVLLFTSIITIVFMLGTFARGAWLAALVMSAIIFIINKEKALALLGISTLICGAAILLSYKNAHEYPLTRKMEQTSSSNRYSGGTQGSALELILQNPIKGYGFGNDLFNQIYNSQVKNRPDWIYKKSLGPHNIFLSIWFAAGIAGLVALILLTIITINYAFKAFIASKDNVITAQAILFLMVSFIGWVIVRGSFENVYLNEIGIYFGLLIALTFRVSLEKTRKTI
ncbi:O-antigen ligase RfaL [Mangrovibacter plantisponsor]|uniref:O-antigen ligase n=1 Tax=Mangrovibacter plantisponsor TaxID=451513 RepID=A0A317PZF0_9ENTR|nr:O-antigen ligase RfaL [Mangrovibacter plantisponsor]PWW05357.1 O-antigen ligase [Mangrovibacter plantisponsor]